ncbi:hypothetical protein VP01_3210g3 [Puccinia sorghi]|uniref:Uncharacterized protein n=1 Tax=Puccinia sorghi TaxID=27349 RepID=A0A0L6UYB0_9BASI|nr:hypothetical protein VP01_3210g3 [Puccinia sorghi]
MGFLHYSYANQAANAIQITLQGTSHNLIQKRLGKQISKQSFNYWMLLYQQTQSFIQNPENYEFYVEQIFLTSENCKCMIQLVHEKPRSFLDGIFECLYDGVGLCSAHNLFMKTLNLGKCLVKNFKYVGIGTLSS